MLPRMLAFMLVTTITLPLVSTAASPRLVINPKEHNFGEVQFGRLATTKFNVRNTGNETLVIRQVRTSCGCTKAYVSSNRLPPKESTELTVTFDSSGLKRGKTIKRIFIESNDRENSVTKVNIFATVRREVIIEPSRLVTKLTASEEQVEFSVIARNQSRKPFTLALSGIQGSLSKAFLKPQEVSVSPGSESRFTITLVLSGNDNPKYFSGRLILETNHPEEKWIGLPYFMKVDRTK